MSYRRVAILYGLLPLLTGFLIYLLFRQQSWLHLQLFSNNAHLPLVNISGSLADIMKYQLPDFCWTFSLTAALMIWKDWWGRPIPFFFGYILLLAAGSELVQLWEIPGFTFDFRDLLAAISGAGLSFWLIDHYEIH